MLKPILFSLAFIWFVSDNVHSQSSGLEFVNLPAGSSLQALGGTSPARIDKDPSIFTINPAMVSFLDKGLTSFSYNPYLAGISHTNASFILENRFIGRMGLSVKYVNYGASESFDPTGNSLGSASANSYLLTASKSRSTGNFSFGVSLKAAGIQLAGYNQYAILSDIGALFKHPSIDFQLGMVIKNLGATWKNYEGNTAKIPFDVQLGGSFKPEHMPFRLGINIQDLNQFNNFPEDEQEIKVEGYRPPSTLKKVANHFILSSELVLTKNFSAFLSYNLKRRQELKGEAASGGAGISLGALVTIKKVSLGFSRSMYSIAAGTNTFTLITNINSIISKKKS